MAPQAMRLWTSKRGPTASSKNDLGDVGGRRPERRGFKWSRGRGSDGAPPPGHPYLTKAVPGANVEMAGRFDPSTRLRCSKLHWLP